MSTNNSINLPNGTTGQLVVGVTGAAGAYASSASADFTFTSATAGATRTLTVTNTDNTNTASNAAEVISVGGTSAGDPYSQYVIGTARSYSWGPDNSDSDILKINTGANATTTPSSGTNIWKMTSTGIRNMPLQPAFLAYASSQQDNVTGDGTVYTVVFDSEITDQGGNFASNTFTAPVTGFYHLSAYVCTIGLSAGHNNYQLRIDIAGTSANNFIPMLINPAPVAVGNQYWNQVAINAPMTAGDTATVQLVVSGSTKTVDVYGQAASPRYTTFSGFLIC